VLILGWYQSGQFFNTRTSLYNRVPPGYPPNTGYNKIKEPPNTAACLLTKDR
jgi:hypothetical protein